jgi:P27 family predicted phage terminase small subunit
VYWRRIVPLLVEQRALTPLHLEALQALCEAWDRYTHFRLWLLEDPARWVFESKSGFPRLSPQATAMSQALEDCRKLWPLFGLHPSGVAGVSAVSMLAEEARQKTIGDEESRPPWIKREIKRAGDLAN